MAHRTQLYLDDAQYQYLKNTARREKKSIAKLIREWVDERRQVKSMKKYLNDPFFKLRGIFSDKGDVAENFDDYLYGGKE